MKKRAWPMALLAASAAALLSLPFFLRPLLPWPDQGLVLQAALRHAQGLGLTAPAPDRHDVTRTHPEPLTYFPPLYARLVSACLSVAGHTSPRPDGPDLERGRALERIVKVTNGAALVVGVLGWCLLAARVLGSRSLGSLLAGLLPVAGGAAVPLGGTADYLLWAALPWWLGLWLAADAAFEEGRRGRALVLALISGALGSALVGVRWAAVFLAPAAALFVGLRARAAGVRAWRPVAQRLLLGGVGLAPIVATYAALTAWNRARSGGVESVLSFIAPRWDFERLLTLVPYESLFSIPLALEPLLTRAWRALEPARASPGLAFLFRVALPVAGLAGLWGSLRRARRQQREIAPSPQARRAFTLAVATLVALVGLLAFLSVRYTWADLNWTYLDEPRYYRPIWPLAALLWLLLLDRLPTASRLRTASAALLLFGILYLLQAHGRAALAHLGPEERDELRVHVRDLERRPGLHVVLDNDVSEHVLTAGARLVPRGYPEPADVPGLRASQPAELWAVRRLREPTPYVRDGDWDRKRFEAVRARFGLTPRWRSSGGAYEIWHARIGP